MSKIGLKQSGKQNHVSVIGFTIINSNTYSIKIETCIFENIFYMCTQFKPQQVIFRDRSINISVCNF